jgi:hypothetical protein
MMRVRVLTAVLVLAALGGPAMAASHDRATFIREQDRNGDGKVSKDEYAAGREGEFVRMDANKDGGLSHDEYVEDFKARLPKKLEALPADKREDQRARELKQVEVRFGVLDSDRSGTITPAEFAYSGWMMFSTHDSNRDGFVGADDPAKRDGE